MRIRCRAACVVLLAAGRLVLPLHAGPASVQFEVGLPEAESSGTLLWGVVRGGIELGRGRQTIEIVTARTGERTAAFDAPLTEAPPEQEPAALAYLCINRDGWESYVPSFGDLHQVAALERKDGRWRVDAPRTGWRPRTAASPDRILTVHYHRFEQDYTNTSLWTWDEHLKRAPAANELLPVGGDDFGLVFQLDTSLYGSAGDKVGLLPRLNADWSFKDGPDRFWSPGMPREVYLVQGREHLQTRKPDVRPKLAAADLDAERTVTLRLTHRVPAAEMTAQRVQVTTEGGAGVGVDLLSPLRPAKGRASMYTITTAEPLDLAKRYQVRVEGVGERSIRLGRILLDPDRFYDPDARLGANYSPERTTFRVFAPTATHVRVVIAETPESRDGEGADETVERDLEPAGRGIWQAVVQGDLQGRFYAYKLTGPAFDPQAEVTDVYATCTQGRHARTLIVDLASTDPPGFREHTFRNPGSPADAVIYEMHVRDFTIAASSGVHHKGKYLGLTESGTHLPGDASIKTGLDHLVELGVTHVQLMPVQDFDNVEDDDAYNWGYMPVHFNAPDGWYATDARGPAKIRELKQAVQALHERGIGAIMDVVYNHTAGGAGFERLVPGYYHRLTPAGRFSNGSGCGNEFHSESPMGRRFILDSVRFWAEEYKIDGFRFDLMGLIDLETMKRIKAELEKIRPGILVYGEPWTGGATPLSPVTGKRQVSGTGIAAFNDRMRDAIKGERDGGPPGFIQAGDRCDGVVTGLKGAIDDWAANPSDSINYFEAHDNLTAWDKLLQSAPSASNTIRKRMMRFAALILFSSQGRPFAHSGQEFCRSKQGHANSYDQPDEVNRIDWGLKKANADVYAYHRGMIALRKAHPLLRLPTREQVESRISFPDPPHERCIVYRLDGTGLEGESAGAILVLLNGHTRQISFPLPAGTWAIHADADRADLHPIGEAAGKIGVPAHSGVLLLR